MRYSYISIRRLSLNYVGHRRDDTAIRMVHRVSYVTIVAIYPRPTAQAATSTSLISLISIYCSFCPTASLDKIAADAFAIPDAPPNILHTPRNEVCSHDSTTTYIYDVYSANIPTTERSAKVAQQTVDAATPSARQEDLVPEHQDWKPPQRELIIFESVITTSSLTPSSFDQSPITVQMSSSKTYTPSAAFTRPSKVVAPFLNDQDAT
ncbi:hypothetical protein CVT26_014475 [Gymnopilus dilepis]|uniref:Uncharacterized protein n=1 Tax=Gymnopilus dilepis TaxID=231916 RepID=A0A409VVD9_9AGAR|nr:hypothetical protein CVT26_014475 [Gymnopilus dilepis]